VDKLSEIDAIPFCRRLLAVRKRMLRNRKVAGAQAAIGGRYVKKIAALKDREGNGILVFGDDKSSRALLVAGLIDEVHLFINPKAVAAGTFHFCQETHLTPMVAIEGEDL